MNSPRSIEPGSPHASEDVRPAGGDEGRRRVRSADLLGSGREIQIEHAGELYTLRQTSKGKLILTK